MSSPSAAAWTIYYPLAPPSDTRLVTIVAHVDHGKTTLADHLISHATTLMSERLAGTLRYLDFDPEEQRRGITIRTSGILLSHSYLDPHTKIATELSVHLHDSPGHSDFGLEVSTSLLATDIALIVIDTVEGMGARTHQVLRETLASHLIPILVLNKIDRLCTELYLSPTEAYMRLRELLETVNASAAAMLASAQADESSEAATGEQDGIDSDTKNLEQTWVFEPAKGNVIFASALYGMGFSVTSVCKSLFQSQTVSIKPKLLAPYLFGDYKINQQNTKVFKWKPHHLQSNEEEVPLFAQFALEPLWKIWNSASSLSSSNGKTLSLEPMVEALRIGATIPAKTNQQSTTSSSNQAPLPTTVAELSTLLSQHGAKSSDAIARVVLKRFRPLATAVLDAISAYGPSPPAAACTFRRQLFQLELSPPVVDRGTGVESTTTTRPNDYREMQQQAIYDCHPDSPIVVAQVCKFLATTMAHLQDKELVFNHQHEPNQGPAILLGLTRVLSGTLETNGEYYTIGSTQPNGDINEQLSPPKRLAHIRLYLLLGSSFVQVERVPAGHICAVSGLDTVLTTTPATICSSPRGLALSTPSTLRHHPPLVKVHMEPVHAPDITVLERGLALLQLADAGVQVTTTSKGEMILACSGELHLEQSIVDLQTKLLTRSIELRISDPIVDFGETTDWMDKEVEQFGAFLEASYGDDSTKHSSTLQRLPPPVRQATLPPYNEEEGLSSAGYGRTRSLLTGRGAALRLRAVPLVPVVHEAMLKRTLVEGCQSELLQLGRALNCDKNASAQEILDLLCAHSLCCIDANGSVMVETPALSSGRCVRGVMTVAPKVNDPQSGGGEVYVSSSTPGVETETDKDASRQTYLSLTKLIRDHGFHTVTSDEEVRSPADAAAWNIWCRDMKGSTVAGFQLAVRAGPLCEEPIRNILVVLEGVEVALVAAPENSNDAKGDLSSSFPSWKPSKPLSGGMVVSAVRTGVRCALLTRPARLMEGILRLTLHSSLSGLGALYSVLSKRRGKVVQDSTVEGTDLLLIEALLPAAEAFGLAPELFGKTSGEVTAPEMRFSHWDRLDVDPFWIPTSLEEREDFGEVQTAGDASTGVDNTALNYIRKVRQRKGFTVDSNRTIVAAEKQRTLKR